MMSTPLDQYFEEKKAGFMNSMMEGAKTVAEKTPESIGKGIAGGVAVGVGAGIMTGAQKIMDAISKRHQFRAMLDHNADLNDQFAENPKFFNQAYSSLRSVNPQFAADPMIAGHYMRQIMEDKTRAGGFLAQALNDSRPQPHPVLDAMSKGTIEGVKMSLQPPKRGGGG